MPTITKKGALIASEAVDRVASLIETDYVALGIPKRVARDFAARCDLLSGRIEATAGVERDKRGNLIRSADFDPSDIGRETKGPNEQDGDETFLQGEFSQQENRELREDQESGNMAQPNTDPQSPTPGVQASFSALLSALKSAKLDGVSSARVAQALSLATDIVRTASEDDDEDDEDEAVDEVESSKKKAGHGFDLHA